MKTTRQIALVMIGLVYTGAGAQQTTGETGLLTGYVIDTSGKSVAAATVIVCDQASGIPVDGEMYKPFTEEYIAAGTESRSRRNQDNPVLYALTDEEGSFRFENVPAGEYRLIAQSWLDADKIERLIEPNGRQIALRGVVEHVRVSGGRAANVTIRPLGNCVLTFDQDMPNDETLLVLSTAPTCADPILGFAGWGGAFMQNMLATNRMPHGETTVSGLPAGTLYFAMFASDSVPGWTDGKVEVRPDVPTVVPETPFVCAWSNGRHEPPAELKPMVDGFLAMKKQGLTPAEDEPIMQLTRLIGEQDFKNGFAYQQWVGRNLDVEFAGPDDGTVKLKDLAAAVSYVQLQASVAKQQEQARQRQEARETFQAIRQHRQGTAGEESYTPPALDMGAPATFFPSDPDAARELDAMWADKWNAIKNVPEGELLEIIRKGLRLTSANRADIIGTIGSQLIWHRSPSDPHAVNILYAASFEPDTKYNAFYYGLTTAKPKPGHVLDRLVELALEGYGGGRIAWGVVDQRDEFLLRMDLRTRTADPVLQLQRRNVTRLIGSGDAGIYDNAAGQIKLQELRQIHHQSASTLDRIKQTLLAGENKARLAELERIAAERLYMLFDDTFVGALEACCDDADSQVRTRVAELAGSYWLWGATMEHPAITDLLLRLSADPMADVRVAALYKGLFNIANKTEPVIRRIVVMGLSKQEPLPEDLYPRVGAVLRRNGDMARKVVLAYRNESQYADGTVDKLYRDAFRSDPPEAP